METRIVICDNRGLTFIGEVDLSGDSEIVTIHNARCIIYWGTTQHLAELALNGPTKVTKLGAAHNVEVFRRQLIASYKVDNPEKWV